MDEFPWALGLAIGAVIGAGVAWFLARARGARDITEAAGRSRADVAATQARLEESLKRITQLEGELQARAQTLEQAHQAATALKAEHARMGAELEGERKAAADKLALLEQAGARLREAFAALSAEALRSNSQSFLELAKASLGEFQKHATSDLEHRQKTIDELVKPLHVSLSRVDTKLQEVEKDRATSYSTLSEQIRSLALTTANLVKALRTPAVRGRWGEMQLKRVVEMADMLDHCDFYEHQSASTEEGRLTPDLLVRLPGGKNVIVDAKAPLLAYLDAFEASDEVAREARMKEHARQVRDHMAKLSNKGYWDQFQPAPEFVFMFLPGENFFSAALEYEPGLIEFGVGRRVIPASPLTLIALLRAVAYGWQQERMAENAQAVSDLGRELHDRIRRMADHFDDMAKGLQRSVSAYNRAVGTLEGRVLVTARRFKDLGITTSEQIPELQPVDQAPRALQAPEVADLLAGVEVVEGETAPDDDDPAR